MEFIYPTKMDRIDYNTQSEDEFVISTRMSTTDDLEKVVSQEKGESCTHILLTHIQQSAQHNN